MNIQGIGHLYGTVGGLTSHALYFFESMNNIAPIQQTHIDFSRPPKITSIENYNADVNILISVPEYCELFKNPKFKGKKIAFAALEHTDFKQTLPFFDSLDELWVPTNWSKNTLIEQNCQKNIKVVPEGVDPKFNPAAHPQKAIKNIPQFKFLYVGRPDVRKNITAVVSAFLEEFQNDDAVLILDTLIKDYQSFRFPKIIHVNPVYMNHGALAGLYTACDAFVLPTHAEGWGLSIIEAMACGLPTITTNYSGHTEYANASNAYMIDYTLSNIPQIHDVPEFYQGIWAEPDYRHLRSLMRYVYEHREEAKTKGMKASEEILSKWTWDTAAKKAFDILQS